MAWYSSWSRAQQLVITVPAATVAPLPYFPVVLTAASLPTELTNNTYGRSDGGDLAFAADLGAGNSVSSIGAQLPCEVVSASFGGSPSAEIHVQVPSVAATGTLTYIWVLYGNSGQTAQPAVSSTYGSQAVWNENGTQNYQGVWHMGNGITLSIADSTSQANNGVTGHLPTVSASGVFGGAANFSGTGQYLPTTNTVNVYPGTFSLWVKAASTTAAAYTPVFANYAGGSHNGWLVEVYPANTDYNSCYFNSASNDCNGESTAGFGALTTSWTLLHGVITSGGLSLYTNGAFVRTVSWAGTPTACTSSYPACFANLPASGGALFAGLLDEGRVAATNRSVSWIAAEYANQSAPGTFTAPSGSAIPTSAYSASLLLAGF